MQARHCPSITMLKKVAWVRSLVVIVHAYDLVRDQQIMHTRSRNYSLFLMMGRTASYRAFKMDCGGLPALSADGVVEPVCYRPVIRVSSQCNSPVSGPREKNTMHSCMYIPEQ